ncbi:hypothetical protein BD311DRAFT_763187 [Dichomitus squalens]|uniref:Uncharacterized protein n=1 Tax=Dichomitus squalens TaxID=114155 RepID=A0A4Q9MFH7_9APHY|nr:hypothetical protein BD311DRAFT_763187 [Dichomitus squalens]
MPASPLDLCLRLGGALVASSPSSSANSMFLGERILLWVYTNPARHVHDSAFYKWHETERTPSLFDIHDDSFFLSCTHFIAADCKLPIYLCLYDLVLPNTVYDPAYIALREKHALEKRRAESVEGRVYEPVDTPHLSPTWSNDTTTDDERATVRFITVVGADLMKFAESEFCRWTRNPSPSYRACPVGFEATVLCTRKLSIPRPAILIRR